MNALNAHPGSNTSVPVQCQAALRHLGASPAAQTSEPCSALPLQAQCNLFVRFSRLHQLDKHCQTTAQQLVELLNKQNQLFKEKQLLTEEVQFLRTQVLVPKGKDV